MIGYGLKPVSGVQPYSLARTCLACLLDRQFAENLIFGQAKISMKNF